MIRWRRWLRLGTLLAATAGLWSCVAPILTVPPPGAVTFTSAFITDASGTQKKVWTTEGGPLPEAANALYFVFNYALGNGVIATAREDGSFTAPPMDGTERDPIRIYYRTLTADYSEPMCVLLSEGVAVAVSCAP